MGGLERYYDKDSLLESIRFNAQFLEMACRSGKREDWQLSQFAELQQLMCEWRRRQYEINNTIDWATQLIEQYDRSFLHAVE